MLWTHEHNRLWDEASSCGRGLAIAREGNGGGVGKSVHAHTTNRRWNCGQSPFNFHFGAMQNVLTMDEEAYELITIFLVPEVTTSNGT